MKECKYCRVTKDDSLFVRVNQSASTRDWCVECKIARAKARNRRFARLYAKTPEYKARKRIWRKNNSALRLAYNRGRKAAKRGATPVWCNKEAIKQIYKSAKAYTLDTGIQHDVDHIVPLIHPLVCGLHVEFNLQVLTASKNNQKGNTFYI